MEWRASVMTVVTSPWRRRRPSTNSTRAYMKGCRWYSGEVGGQSRLRGQRAHQVGISMDLDRTGAVGGRPCFARVDHSRTMCVFWWSEVPYDRPQTQYYQTQYSHAAAVSLSSVTQLSPSPYTPSTKQRLSTVPPAPQARSGSVPTVSTRPATNFGSKRKCVTTRA